MALDSDGSECEFRKHICRRGWKVEQHLYLRAWGKWIRTKCFYIMGIEEWSELTNTCLPPYVRRNSPKLMNELLPIASEQAGAA